MCFEESALYSSRVGIGDSFLGNALYVIYQTRERVFLQDIQTLKSGLKKRGAAEFF